MEWSHDPDGEHGSEGRRKYGHTVIAKKVNENEDFPLDCDTFVSEYGDHPVRIDNDTVVSVADVFEHVEGAEFAEFIEFNQAFGRAMRQGELWSYEGAGEFVGTGNEV
ncbi:DUF5785 family protein [Haloquadratum walsbyi]|jgi:hypothetical protein|nr:DUF5785 family protein [Haloquadratum walsbyi]